MKKLAFAIICTCLTTTGASAAPFGIAQSTPTETLQIKSRYGTKWFIVTPPQPNPKFAEYHVYSTPPDGVCGIIATTEPFADYKAAYREQKQIEKLLSRYGKANPVKFGRNSPLIYMSPGEGPVQWTRGLPDNLNSILIETIERKGEFFVELSYSYRNISRCDNWEPEQNRTGL